MREPLRDELGARNTFLLLRWVLIIATSYLVIFSRPLRYVSPSAALFVAAYLGSNLLLPRLRSRIRPRRRFEMVVVLFDTIAVAVGLGLAGGASSDFFSLYFLVLFLAAMTQRLQFVVCAAALISVIYLSMLSASVGPPQLFAAGYLLRFPFLFAVALFFGAEVETTRRRERTEVARARKLRRSEIMSAVTHDLKNPLSNIQSIAELFLEGETGPLTDGQSDLMRRTHASARYLMHLTVNLLDASQIDAGKLTLHRTPANVADIIQTAVERSRTASELKHITLNVESAAPAVLVAVDTLQIERVISNLVDNAIRYTPEGGAVTVSFRMAPGELAVEVRDTGCGIPETALPHVFEKYRRRVAAKAVEGWGLGLFIVKAIVEAHGGSVAIRSAVGRGTSVTVRLPTARPESAAAPQRTAPAKRWAWRPIPHRA